MATIANRSPMHDLMEHARVASHHLTRYLVPIGRALFALIFLAALPAHLSSQGIAYADSQGVPFAHVLVPASGVLALVGGLSIALGFQARLGGLLLALFLIPVTVMMHRFWTIPDPQAAMIQQAMFMKNVAMLGGALLLTHFGAGPFSLDARKYKHRG